MPNITALITSLKDFAQIFALVFAGCFFIWKWMSGALIANMDVDPIIERYKKNDSKDYIKLTIKLKKGDRACIQIKDLKINFSDEGTVKEINQKYHKLSSPNLPEENRMVLLSPGESTQFSYIYEVDSEKVYNIEIYIKGSSIIFEKLPEKPSQWKASSVSLPKFSST